MEPAFSQTKARVYPIADLDAPFDDVSGKNAVTKARPFPKRLTKKGFFSAPAEEAGMVYEATLPLRNGWTIEVSHSGFPAATSCIEAGDTIELDVTVNRHGKSSGAEALPLPLKHHVYGILKTLTK